MWVISSVGRAPRLHRGGRQFEPVITHHTKESNISFYKQFEQLIEPALEHDSIGIMLSGGIDSATLLWCTLNVIKDNNLSNTVTVYTSPRSDNSLAFAQKIREHIEQQLDIKLKHKMRGSGAVHHSEQVWSAMTAAMNDCDIVMTAETAQPEHMFSDHFERKLVEHDKSYQPFFNLTKDFTIGLAIE